MLRPRGGPCVVVRRTALRVCRVLEEACNADGGSPHNHQQQPTPTIPLFPQHHLLRPSTLFSTREQGSRGEVPHHQLCTSRQCRTSDLLLLSPQVLLLRQSVSSNVVVIFADDVWSAGVVLLFSCLQLYATTVVVGDGSADDDDGEGTTAQQHTMDKSFGNDASSMLLLRDVVNDVIIPSGTPLSHLRGYYALVERLRRGLSDELQRQQENEEKKGNVTSSGNRRDNHDDEPDDPIACLVNTIVASSHIDRDILVQLCHMIHPSGSHRLEHFAAAHHIPLSVVKTLLQQDITSIVATSNEEEVEEDNDGSAPTTTMGKGRGWKHWMRRLPPLRSRATTSIGAMTLLQQQQHQVRGMILSRASPFVDIRAQCEVWRSYIEQQCSLENGATSGPQAELQKTAAVWTAWVELLWALTNVGGGSGSSTTSSSSPTQTTATKRGDRLGSELSVALLQSYPSLFMLSATAAAATAAVTSVVTLSPSASSTSLLLSPAVSPKSSSPLTTGGATAFPTTTTTLTATSMTPTATVAQMIASTSSRASAFLCALLNKHLLSSSFVGRVQGEGDDAVVELCVPSAVLRHMWRTPSQQVGGGSSPYANGIVASPSSHAEASTTTTSTSSPDTFSPTFPASSTLLTEVEERFQRRYGAAPPSLSTVVVPPPLNPEWYNSSHHSLLLPTSQQQSSTFDHHQNCSILSPLVGGGAAQRSRRHQQQGHAALHNSTPSMKLQHPQRDGSHQHKTPQHRREQQSEFVAINTPEMHLVAFEQSSSCDANFITTLRKLINRSEALLCALSTQPPNNVTNIDNDINTAALPPEENRRRRLLLVSELKSVWEGMRGAATSTASVEVAKAIALTATTTTAVIPRVPSQFRGYLWRAMLSLALSSLRPSSSASSSSADIAPNTDAFALLPLSGLHDVFSRIDVRTPTCNDRQVAVDIPRCHQYDPFLSSPEGQRKLLHVIKAWLATAPTMMYWQGVDSVVAVLLHATNGDEALSLLLLSLMLRRWIPHFFLKGNQGAMEHRLMQLSLLLRYYDPELAHHVFDKLECKPELFAISWFLTIFAHVLPVRKCTVVWDFVFGSGSPEATVCLACAVMLELRDSLMHASDFPTVVSLLSGSFAAMDVLHLLQEASLLLACTPPSVLEPALSDPVTASLVKTSCCCLLSPADLAGVTRKNLDSVVDARVNVSWASKGGVLLLDIRTNDERRRGGGGHSTQTSSAKQSRNATTTSQATKIISGAVEVAFDTLRGWRVEGPIGSEDEQPDDFVMVDAADGRDGRDEYDDHIHRAGAMDGEPVLRLLGKPHMLWYPAAPNNNTTSSITAASSPSASSAAFAGASAISESPHVVIITGTEPEDGQSAVESLQRLGVAKVSMLLGGIKALEAAVPYAVVIEAS